MGKPKLHFFFYVTKNEASFPCFTEKMKTTQRFEIIYLLYASSRSPTTTSLPNAISSCRFVGTRSNTLSADSYYAELSTTSDDDDDSDPHDSKPLNLSRNMPIGESNLDLLESQEQEEEDLARLLDSSCKEA